MTPPLLRPVNASHPLQLPPPVTTTITILKSSPTCLITQFPHQEKAKIDSESSSSKLFQTCETPRSLSAMCHLCLLKTSRTNEYRRMCHLGWSSPTTDPISRCRVFAKCSTACDATQITTTTQRLYIYTPTYEVVVYSKTTILLKYEPSQRSDVGRGLLYTGTSSPLSRFS